ncbi:hypothetical protein [Nitrosomonas sp. Nm34]|uniref:hypothetical protein n=1 Tax=Nitrosomonas sp. Nm34 TaxID=1881055 RepID=UPI0008ECE0EB|nr:hypothetical protein [Nitrosomonas sp. Nm34]SFJ00070.1 hypothetical protein SAMN05428978_10783 [Nitrosomonas sp. Nm34]
MSILEKHIDFVKNQIAYHQRQSEKLGKKNDSRSDRTCSNHKKVLEDLVDLAEFLESIPKDLSSLDKKSKAVSSSLHILPSDLEGLPQELLDELNISDSDKQELEIIKSLENAGGVLTIDKLMIQLYRDTGAIHNRKQLAAKLYRMTSKGLLRSNQDKRGAFEIADSLQPENQNEW